MSAHAPTMTRFIPSAHIPSLDEVDHSLALTHDEYKLQLKAEQERLRRIELEMYIRRVPMMIMYEGWDAAGKGGSIKRVAQALDARSYTIFPSPAPTKPELLHPHLWRYWTRLPKAGHVGIYDRSWYGRVLVERVEGFASTDQWSRAYEEINEFERDMVDWAPSCLSSGWTFPQKHSFGVLRRVKTILRNAGRLPQRIGATATSTPSIVRR